MIHKIHCFDDTKEKHGEGKDAATIVLKCGVFVVKLSSVKQTENAIHEPTCLSHIIVKVTWKYNLYLFKHKSIKFSYN